MDTWILIIAILMGGYWLGVLWICWFGIQRLPVLKSAHPDSSKISPKMSLNNTPLVSVIVAAKDEALHIEDTVRQLLAQIGVSMEIIVVNDRSSDRTGDVLNRLKYDLDESLRSNELGESMPFLEAFQVIHVRDLPQGWLGKNHALWIGTQHACGEWLLFADADIRFESDALASAMGYVLENEVDHLTLAPRFLSRTIPVRAFIGLFLFSLNLVLRPWRCNDDRRRDNGVGVGAFNLVKRSVYEAVGTHRALALRPDDDLILGKKIKEQGFRQRFVLGHPLISVEWYPTVHAAVNGLEKNVFAGFGYSIPLACLMIFGYFFQFHFPFWMLGYVMLDSEWVFPFNWGLASIGSVAAVGVFVAITLIQALAVGWTSWRFNRAMAWDLLLLPRTSFMVGYTLLRSVWLANWRGGVYWRGTFYALRELKKMTKSDRT